MKLLAHIILLCITSLCISCKSDRNANTADSSSELYTAEIPQNFITFLNKFGQDSSFQMSHIQFPLSGISASDPSLPKVWTENDWDLHRPFNDQGGSFEQNFRNLNGIIIEKTFAPGTSFSMERRFIADGNGSYTLIYYDEMRDLSGSFN